MLRDVAIVLFFMALALSWIISIDSKDIENNIVACGYVEEIENSNIS